jgi:hypothetical protein
LVPAAALAAVGALAGCADVSMSSTLLSASFCVSSWLCLRVVTPEVTCTSSVALHHEDSHILTRGDCYKLWNAEVSLTTSTSETHWVWLVREPAGEHARAPRHVRARATSSTTPARPRLCVSEAQIQAVVSLTLTSLQSTASCARQGTKGTLPSIRQTLAAQAQACQRPWAQSVLYTWQKSDASEF